MQKRLLTALLCLLVLSLSGFAQHKKTAAKKFPSGPALDKAYMQKIWDGWSTLNPSNTAQYYAPGDHAFFDVAPLRYSNWQEYEQGVSKILGAYKSAKFTVNDDAVAHQHGDLAWGTATVKEDAITKAGKREMATLRWTVIWERQDGKWLIVHEHVSEPLQ